MSLVARFAQRSLCARRQLFTRRFASSPSRSRLPSSLIWGSAIGVAACLAYAPWVNVIQLDSDVDKPAQSEPEDPETVIDPQTSIAFPKTIRVPATINIPPLSLVGVGVRTVSFLGIKVYSVGFYADLGNPNLKVPSTMSPDEKIEHIVRNTACVVRIVPTRSTSYTHLRDAFMRALQGRIALGMKTGTLTDEVAQEASSPMRKLKSIFPNSPLAKHTPLDIFLSPPTPGRPRALIFRDLGAIENDWVATEFVLHYFEGEGPSPPLKKAVIEHLEHFQK